jgi:hypothetical protein
MFLTLGKNDNYVHLRDLDSGQRVVVAPVEGAVGFCRVVEADCAGGGESPASDAY